MRDVKRKRRRTGKKEGRGAGRGLLPSTGRKVGGAKHYKQRRSNSSSSSSSSFSSSWTFASLSLFHSLVALSLSPSLFLFIWSRGVLNSVRGVIHLRARGIVHQLRAVTSRDSPLSPTRARYETNESERANERASARPAEAGNDVECDDSFDRSRPADVTDSRTRTGESRAMLDVTGYNVDKPVVFAGCRLF